MLKVEGLSFRYKSGAEILRGVDFTLGDGKLMAVLGNNGAGKSTMLKCLCKILRPQAGHAQIDGEELLSMSHREAAKRLAFVAQSVPETQMTVHDVVMLGRRPYMRWGFTEADHEAVHEAMDQLEVSGMRGRFFNELSGGERQKVTLARALAQRPKLLLLDEPTSNLDIKNQYQVLEIVQGICRDTGITAMVVIHELNLALRFCDSLLLLKDGEVYRSGDTACLDRKALLEVYGINAEVVSVNGQGMVAVD